MLTIRAIDSRAGKGNMLLESELFYEQTRRGAGMSNHCSGHSMESMSKSSPAPDEAPTATGCSCCCPPPVLPDLRHQLACIMSNHRSNHCAGHSMESMSKSSPCCCCPPPAGPAPPAGLLPATLPAGDTPPGRTRHGGIGREDVGIGGEDVGIGGEDVRIGGEDVVTLGLSAAMAAPNLGRPTECNE